MVGMAEPVTLTPTADCWVNDFPENLNHNFNGMGLGMGRWSALNRSLLKFDLENLPIAKEAVVSAELRLYGKSIVSPCIVEAIYTANGFNESLVTWNNQPLPTTYHWDGEGSLMGSTTNIPLAEGWYAVPLNPVFIKHRWNRNLFIILKGHEAAEDSYCYAYDREEEAGAFAPQLVLYTEAAPPPPPPPSVGWLALAGLAGLVWLTLRE